MSISLTKVKGRHTMKAGFFNTHSFKAEQATGTDSFGNLNFQQDTVGTNAFDTSFGFANAAIGSFSSFTQASNYIEGDFVYDNREAYVQDNWKVNNRLTLDYGMRFVNALPQYDSLGQGNNFLPDKWTQSAAPQLYQSGCAVTVSPGTACPSHEPPGVESRDRPAARSQHVARRSARSCRAPAVRPTVSSPAATGLRRKPTRSRRLPWRRDSAWPTT